MGFDGDTGGATVTSELSPLPPFFLMLLMGMTVTCLAGLLFLFKYTEDFWLGTSRLLGEGCACGFDVLGVGAADTGILCATRPLFSLSLPLAVFFLTEASVGACGMSFKDSDEASLALC